MNNAEKIRFVKDLTESVCDSVTNCIRSGKVPEEWDGIELRHLLAEKFRQYVPAMSKSRKSNYDNHIAITSGL